MSKRKIKLELWCDDKYCDMCRFVHPHYGAIKMCKLFQDIIQDRSKGVYTPERCKACLEAQIK